jgi:importin subunit alpha-6/7
MMACQIIARITAATAEQIQAVIDNNIIPPLIRLFADSKFDVHKEAVQAIANAVGVGSDTQIQLLVQQGCIQPFWDLLTMSDSKTVSQGLQCLTKILVAGERADSKDTVDRIGLSSKNLMDAFFLRQQRSRRNSCGNQHALSK